MPRRARPPDAPARATCAEMAKINGSCRNSDAAIAQTVFDKFWARYSEILGRCKDGGAEAPEAAAAWPVMLSLSYRDMCCGHCASWHGQNPCSDTCPLCQKRARRVPA